MSKRFRRSATVLKSPRGNKSTSSKKQKGEKSAVRSLAKWAEVHESNWIYWDRTQFPTPGLEARKGKDDKKTSMETHLVLASVTATYLCQARRENGNKPPNFYSRKSKKIELEMKRQKLSSTCINVLKEPVPSQLAVSIQSLFSLDVAEKLS